MVNKTFRNLFLTSTGISLIFYLLAPTVIYVVMGSEQFIERPFNKIFFIIITLAINLFALLLKQKYEKEVKEIENEKLNQYIEKVCPNAKNENIQTKKNITLARRIPAAFLLQIFSILGVSLLFARQHIEATLTATAILIVATLTATLFLYQYFYNQILGKTAKKYPLFPNN